MTAAVVRNDWSTLAVPELDAWTPTQRVSVVIPAYRCQESLDLTLASLSRQTYPAELLEVVVVDDGSRPPLRLPPIRPVDTRLVRTGTGGWGIANASNVGVRAATGEIVLRLDADMVVFAEHVEAHARWHHQIPYAVTLGQKRFVDVRPGEPGWPTPEQVATQASALFDVATTEPHRYIEDLLAATDQLRRADHLVFGAHVGATVAWRRELFEAAGGFDPALRRGSDTELGYRLVQAGAVFIPETAARSWHLGPSSIMRGKHSIARYSRPFLADVMPHPRWMRRQGGSAWAVPLVAVVIEVDDQPMERVRAAVDSVLSGDERDLRVELVARWSGLGEEPRHFLDDPRTELRLLAATYRSDPRVRRRDTMPETVFPAPYLLRMPASAGLTRWAVSRLVDVASRHQVGLVQVHLPGSDRTVELWRTAAIGRARWLDAGPEHQWMADATRHEKLVRTVAATHGRRALTPASAGVIDLSDVPPERFEAGMGPVPTAAGGLRWLPSSIEVGGVRSLARAALLVSTLSARRATARLSGLLRHAAR